MLMGQASEQVDRAGVPGGDMIRAGVMRCLQQQQQQRITLQSLQHAMYIRVVRDTDCRLLLVKTHSSVVIYAVLSLAKC